MATKRNELKNYFLNGKIPNQEQFAALIDDTLIKTDDKLTISPVIVDGNITNTRVGINDATPDTPLSIKAQSGGIALTLKSAVTDTKHWRFLVNQSSGVTATGLTIAREETSGLVPRMHIDDRGFVGIGTQTPQSVLSVTASELNGSISIRLKNGECSNSWMLAHTSNDNEMLNERFSIHSVNAQGAQNERFTIRENGNVGIGTSLPMVKFSVEANPQLPGVPVALDNVSGAVLLGTTTQNLALDPSAIQVRATSNGTTTAATLSLQPLGGTIEIHAQGTEGEKVIVAANGHTSMGVGTSNSRLELKGSIRLHEDLDETGIDRPGTFRFRNNLFEGHNGSEWVTFNTTAAAQNYWQTVDAVETKIRFAGDADTGAVNVIVGNGPQAAQTLGTFSVYATGTEASGTLAAAVINHNRTNAQANLTTSRFGLALNMPAAIANTNTASRDVGLWVRTYDGTVPRPENRLAAIFDGNVVIGTHLGTGTHIGAGGSNVLAISTEGSAPAEAKNTAVQVYAKETSVGGQVALHLLNPGQTGRPVKLYATPKLAAAAPEPVDTGNTELNAYIANMVTRIADLEARLVTLGLLMPQA
jgi:hypothetical protein